MTNHPHLAQIQDLLKAGPELAAQLCLGVTDSHEQARELFVEACMKATTIVEQSPEIWYFVWRPWDSPHEDSYWDFESQWGLRAETTRHYTYIFDQLNPTE